MTPSELAELAYAAMMENLPAEECDRLAAEAARAYREEIGLPVDERYGHLRSN